jgi:hypothetical protein
MLASKGVYSQLSPEGVRTDETRLPVLLLVVVGQLRAGGRLTRALHTVHKYWSLQVVKAMQKDILMTC